MARGGLSRARNGVRLFRLSGNSRRFIVVRMGMAGVERALPGNTKRERSAGRRGGEAKFKLANEKLRFAK